MSKSTELKTKYHDAYKAMCDTPNGTNEPKYSFAMLQALRDMAEADVYPDGTFGDEECNVWSMFHSFHMKAKEV